MVLSLSLKLSLLALCFSMTQCVTLSEQQAEEKAYLHKTHPLVGSVWSTKEARLIGEAELHTSIQFSDTVMIGEYHDNPQHHRLQATIISRLPGKKAIVGFEQLDDEQKPKLDNYLKESSDDAEGLGEAVGWKKSGWPPYPYYKPIFAAILTKKWHITPLMFARQKTKAIFKEGYPAIFDKQEIKELGLMNAFPKAVIEYRAGLMNDAHCGMMPAKILLPLVSAQIAKDAYMAQSLHRQIEGKRGVVIAGNGHVRKDWGIPVFLAKLRPKSKITVISIIEVDPKKLDPSQYLEASVNLSDYVVFTAAYSRTDPCERMKTFKEKMKKNKQNNKPSKDKIQKTELDTMLDQVQL